MLVFKSGFEQEWIVCSFLESHQNLPLRDINGRMRIDKITEDRSGFGSLIALADFISKESVKAAAHQRKLQIAIHFHRNGRRKCVHVEEVDAVLDAVLNDHSSGIALDEFGSRAAQLVGQ